MGRTRLGVGAIAVGLLACILFAEPRYQITTETLPTLDDYASDYMDSALVLGH